MFVNEYVNNLLRLVLLNLKHFHETGGPMFWADNYVGLPTILSKLEELHQIYPGSEYFLPSNLLRKCVDMGLGVQEYYNTAGMSSRL